MAVLVTGGAGFIGSHTCVELLNAGKDIVVVDNFSNSKPASLRRIRQITGKEFPFYKADLRDKEALRTVFSENSIDSVIHFAGLKAVGESVQKPLLYYSHNFESTFTLCEVMKEFGVGKMVFSSSATVYGEAKEVPVTEETPTVHAASPYGETKLVLERVLSDLCAAGDLESVMILRYFNPIGAHPSGLIGENPNGVPNNLLPYISMVSVGKLDHLRVYGDDFPTPDGTGIRDYIHVVDLAQAHLKALERAEKVRGTEYYNLGTGHGYSVLEVIRAYENATGAKVPYRICPRRPGDISISYCDPTKARQYLGWKAQYGIEKMCEDLFRWQSMNPDGYPDESETF